MAKPGKTDILNACVALSMNAWAKSTIDLDRRRESKRRRVLQARIRTLGHGIAGSDRQRPIHSA
jgi:hypothetical protein